MGFTLPSAGVTPAPSGKKSQNGEHSISLSDSSAYVIQFPCHSERSENPGSCVIQSPAAKNPGSFRWLLAVLSLPASGSLNDWPAVLPLSRRERIEGEGPNSAHASRATSRFRLCSGRVRLTYGDVLLLTEVEEPQIDRAILTQHRTSGIPNTIAALRRRLIEIEEDDHNDPLASSAAILRSFTTNHRCPSLHESLNMLSNLIDVRKITLFLFNHNFPPLRARR